MSISAGIKKAMWILGSIVVGELALAVLTTIAQEVIFDGIGYNESPFWELLVGGILTVLAAIGAGWIARKIIRKRRLIIPLGIAVLILIESYYLVFIRGSDQPLWFEMLAVLSLIFGIWFGFYLPDLNHAISIKEQKERL
ncbi:MAG: hypothetical protein OEM26_19660 [Saprospiraceae bacterium]|nr:hypothetical protein [Saprospiraceae bacterium]